MTLSSAQVGRNWSGSSASLVATSTRRRSVEYTPEDEEQLRRETDREVLDLMRCSVGLTPFEICGGALVFVIGALFGALLLSFLT